MTENNPPTGGDAFWERPDGTRPEPTLPLPTQPLPPVQPPPSWGGDYPPPGTFPPGNYPQPGTWPAPDTPWPNQAPPYPSGQGYSAHQQPGPMPGQPYYPQQPGYPSGLPGSPASPYPAPPAKPRRTGLVILLSVLGLCLLLVVGSLLLGQPTTPTAVPGRPGNSATPGGATTTAAATAADAVRGYLDSLAAGDADAALSYAVSQPPDDALLTDEVLAAGNADAPITGIEVEPSTAPGSASVSAHYSIGPNDIDEVFSVVDTPSGWKLTQVAAEITVDRFPAIATINGAAVTLGDTVTLFPGSYRAGTDDARYRISGGTFFVNSPSETGSLKVTATLSDSGVAAVHAAAQKRLSDCLKQNKAMPSDNCGFGINLVERTTGKTIKAKTIRWRVTSGTNAAKTFTPKVDPDSARVVTGKPKVKLRVDITATNGRRYWGTAAISTVRAILSDGSISVRFNQ